MKPVVDTSPADISRALVAGDLDFGLMGYVTAIPAAFADQPAALERGDVDAYVGTEPLFTQSVVSGRRVRINELYGTPAGDVNTAMWAAPKNLGDADLLRAVTKMQRDAAEC